MQRLGWNTVIRVGAFSVLAMGLIMVLGSSDLSTSTSCDVGAAAGTRRLLDVGAA